LRGIHSSGIPNIAAPLTFWRNCLYFGRLAITIWRYNTATKPRVVFVHGPAAGLLYHYTRPLKEELVMNLID